jgi:hypothetical protein
VSSHESDRSSVCSHERMIYCDVDADIEQGALHLDESLQPAPPLPPRPPSEALYVTSSISMNGGDAAAAAAAVARTSGALSSNYTSQDALEAARALHSRTCSRDNNPIAIQAQARHGTFGFGNVCSPIYTETRQPSYASSVDPPTSCSAPHRLGNDVEPVEHDYPNHGTRGPHDQHCERRSASTLPPDYRRTMHCALRVSKQVSSSFYNT